MKKIIALVTAALIAAAGPAAAADLWFGADLSFAGQMTDCGARYRDTDGQIHDVYTIFRNHGANLIRFRLWTEGNRTGYSDLADVERGIRNARALGMQVQLDFHYSDSWADAEHQIIPQGWAEIAPRVTDGRPQAQPTHAEQLAQDRALADTLYEYTHYVLTTLDRQGLMPDEVQVGNEINPEMLGYGDWQVVPYSNYNRPIDWERDALLINAGIKAVRDAGAKSAIKPRIMLQIAHADAVEAWFAAATKAGVTDYDMIGISFYAYHNATATFKDVGDVIRHLRQAYPGKMVEVIETGYPWTSDPDRLAHSNPNVNDLMPEYPATPDGQKRFLVDLSRAIVEAGGTGLNYWAPDQIANKCNVRGNTAYSLFDADGKVLPGIDFMKAGKP